MIENSCGQANRIDLVDYLASLNYQPTKIRNNDYWYLSPLRNEKEASFKINRKLNVWYDHGIGKGGTVIDFGIIYHKCTVRELLSKLTESNIKNFSFQPPFAGEKKKLSGDTGKIMIIDSRIISGIGLIKYLEERKIPLLIAKKYCNEIDFELYGKKHTAIGFKNNAGGFELRNNYFKGSSSPKGITLIKNNDEDLAVFEGFFSFLSFETQNLTNKIFESSLPKMQGNFLILNSLSFFENSRELMEKHSRIHLYLDRDNSGIKNTTEALKWSSKYIDKSHHYKSCKDFNEFLIMQQKDEIKQKHSLRRRL